MEYFFKKALPIWEDGKEKEKNYTVVFKADFEYDAAGKIKVAIACSNSYTLFVCGSFVSFGPARTGHGRYAVDVIDITKYSPACGEIVIYVSGYNTDSFEYLNQPSFLTAEILSGDDVLAATGFDFSGYEFDEKLKKVQRFSYQRAYTEHIVSKTNNFDMSEYNVQKSAVQTSIMTQKRYFDREVPYPDFEKKQFTEIINRGVISVKDKIIRPYEDRALNSVPEISDGFKKEELEFCESDFVGKTEYKITDKSICRDEKFSLSSNEFITLCGERNNVGLLSFTAEVSGNAKIIITFDEMISEDGLVDYIRNAEVNILMYELKNGVNKIISLEPYVMKYINIAIVGDGDVQFGDLSLIEYKFPKINYTNPCKAKKLREIFDAAVETFRMNAVDVFTDCPSRERGGYLCDSYFTARAEFALTGKSVVEKSFLYNFIRYNDECNIPDGMLPMCYPAEFYSKMFIPNWAMWFVIELYEYVQRSGDTQIVKDAKKRVYNVLNYFGKFENSLGILEKLDGWIFIEWSDSNKYVKDINFPTNMLYYKFKVFISELYNDEKLKKEAEKLKENIINLSYDGVFFHDRAIASVSGYTVTDEITETAQYYAFFSGIAEPDKNDALLNNLINHFGTNRDELFNNVSPSNMFIGNYLRLQLLKRINNNELLLKEIEEMFYYMAEKTGTLWEDKSFVRSSLCHGFASYIICLLY